MTDGPYTTITVEEYNRLMAVVRAAEDLRANAYSQARSYSVNPGDPPAIIQLKDLELALAALHNPDQGGDRSQGGMSDGL